MRLKLPAIILLFAALIASASVAQGQSRSISYGSPSPTGISLGVYQPKIFQTLDALPANVRTKIDDHLRTRLGNAFYSQIVFVNGSSINVADFLRANPRTQWRVHTYELVFKYADAKHGLREYYARFRLDSNGDVIDEINLPKVAKFPLKGKIISIDDAIAIAKSHGHLTKGSGTNLTIDYLEDIGSLAWEFKSYSSNDASTVTAKVLIIDAHSGAILKDGFESGIK
jgi:hypothetical protein